MRRRVWKIAKTAAALKVCAEIVRLNNRVDVVAAEAERRDVELRRGMTSAVSHLSGVMVGVIKGAVPVLSRLNDRVGAIEAAGRANREAVFAGGVDRDEER